jgi:hypothetical protein
MLNSGYKQGPFVDKCEKEKNGSFKIIHLDPYSPKVFGSIKNFDSVLATRCILLIMPPLSGNKDIVFREVEYNDPDWSRIVALQRQGYTFILEDCKFLERG